MKKVLILAVAVVMASVALAERCAATTRKGTQCKREAQEGSVYCWQHHRMYNGPTQSI